MTDQINIGGQAIPPSGFRTSTTSSNDVNPDGTGTLMAAFSCHPGPMPLSFVIVDRKNELQVMRTDAGVAQGIARRQVTPGNDDQALNAASGRQTGARDTANTGRLEE